MPERVKKEIGYCLMFEPEQREVCRGAGEHKRRRLCIWCPNYIKEEKERSDENARSKAPGRGDHV